MHLGIAHHLGWAIAVTAGADGTVADRRRIVITEEGLPPAPFEHDVPHLDDQAATALLDTVRAGVARVASAALGELVTTLGQPIVSMSLRYWRPDFPHDLESLRRPPHNAVADSVMYRQVLAELAFEHRWAVHLYDAAAVEQQAAVVLRDRASEVLHDPRARLGPPWTKDHRIALAAAILAARQ